MAHGRSRYAVFLFVLALHIAIIAYLIVSSKARRLLSASPPPIELLLLLPRSSAAQKIRTEKPVELIQNIESRPNPVNHSTPAPQVVEPGQSSEPSVDWETEARSVAAAVASKPTAADRDKDDNDAHPPKSIFPQPPAHHAGDEFALPTGERAVFVSDKCYQVSSTKPSNATNNGMVNPTYCIGKSKSPRGDLFKELPAYQKYREAEDRRKE